ncbi:MAG: SDR family NAD(P)-dependent oxidoreductase [Idiomarina sp.]|nr:SDR family NAD(P)-dependent oxidoreductase [Idiomarina sp.]
MHYLIIGASGGLGQALLQHYAKSLAQGELTQLSAMSRQARPAGLDDTISWYQVNGDLSDYQQVFTQLEAEQAVLHGVVSTIGWLHQGDWQPERRIEALDEAQLNAYFAVNATLPIMLLQGLKPILARKEPAFVAQLGAKVGSISDNQLGGWYGYRASKAALNMLFKTAAIEFKRTHKKLSLAVIHPGTTDTELSKPFQQRIADGKLFSAEQSAARIAQVINNLDPSDSGGFWFWDGSRLPY